MRGGHVLPWLIKDSILYAAPPNKLKWSLAPKEDLHPLMSWFNEEGHPRGYMHLMLGGELIDCTSIVFEIDAKASVRIRKWTEKLALSRCIRGASEISMCCPFDAWMLEQTKLCRRRRMKLNLKLE